MYTISYVDTTIYDIAEHLIMITSADIAYSMCADIAYSTI